MKVVFSGGGTLGPVTPLLAIYESSKNSGIKFFWIGTKTGPEKSIVEKYGIEFYSISDAKLRRYFSFWNLIDFFKFIKAFFQSLFFLLKEKPNLLISAGGFVSVPLHLAGALLGIPAWVHQQDFRIGLTNKIIAPFAKKITVALEKNLYFFPNNKTEWIGNPVRSLFVESKEESIKKFNLTNNQPIILAMGGGTGSAHINKLIVEALPQLPSEWQIIHITGKQKRTDLSNKISDVFENYHAYDFLKGEMKDAYAIADLVFARAGFASITEIASLKKPLILLPMAGTHQEDNVKFLLEKNAVLSLDERVSTGSELSVSIKKIIENKEEADSMANNLYKILPPTKKEKILEILKSLLN